jgi:hypothetical protein
MARLCRWKDRSNQGCAARALQIGASQVGPVQAHTPRKVSAAATVGDRRGDGSGGILSDCVALSGSAELNIAGAEAAPYLDIERQAKICWVVDAKVLDGVVLPSASLTTAPHLSSNV